MESIKKEMGHTPGPWQFYVDSPSTDPNWHIVTNSSRTRIVANVHVEPGNPADLANARLIAAGPEMLAELERLLSVVGDEDHASISAVIAKATNQQPSAT